MNKKNLSISTSGLALVVTSLYLLYDKINKPPQSTRHIPYIGFFKFMSAIIRKEPIYNVTKEMTFPVSFTTESGLYSVKKIYT